MGELFNHLRENERITAYSKLLVWRHRKTIAYLFLTFAVAYAIWGIQKQNDQDDKRQKQAQIQGSQQRKAIAEAGVSAVAEGCIRDANTIRQLRKIIIVGRNQIDQYVSDGTISKAAGERAKQQSNDSLKTLPLPNCQTVVDRYRNKVTPPAKGS